MWGQYVQEMFILSSSLRCDQIKEYERYDFGHIQFCYLSQLLVKQTTSEAIMLNN